MVTPSTVSYLETYQKLFDLFCSWFLFEIFQFVSCSKRSLNAEQKIHTFLNFDSTQNNIRKPHISTLTSRKSNLIALWRSVCLTVFTMQIIFHSKSVNSSSFSFIELLNVSITCVIKLNDCLSFGLITISRRALARRASSIKVSQTFDLSSRKNQAI